MSWIRAPAARTSAMRSSCRGRSRMTTVMSLTRRPRASAIRPRFSVGLTVMSTLPAAPGPTHKLLEVGVRRVRQTAGLGGREDRDRSGLSVSDGVRALERIDSDVDGGHVDSSTPVRPTLSPM